MGRQGALPRRSGPWLSGRTLVIAIRAPNASLAEEGCSYAELRMQYQRTGSRPVSLRTTGRISVFLSAARGDREAPSPYLATTGPLGGCKRTVHIGLIIRRAKVRFGRSGAMTQHQGSACPQDPTHRCPQNPADRTAPSYAAKAPLSWHGNKDLCSRWPAQRRPPDHPPRGERRGARTQGVRLRSEQATLPPTWHP